MFQDDNSIFLMLEFVAGGELFSHLRRNQRFPDDHAKFYTTEIAIALRTMHRLDIAYRDVKPENILIARSGHVKLVDFGLSKIVTDRTFTLCG